VLGAVGLGQLVVHPAQALGGGGLGWGHGWFQDKGRYGPRGRLGSLGNCPMLKGMDLSLL